jgi:hypothetical protein
MKLKIITFCLLFAMIFNACKKEEIGKTGNSVTSENTAAILLSKVLTDNQSTFEYIYTDSTRVSEEKSKYYYTVHDYNDKGQLISTEYYGNDDILSSDLQTYQAAVSNTVWVTPANGKLGGTVSYQYNDNGQLIKATYTGSALTTTEYSEFSSNANSRITRQNLYWDNAATGYIDYSYDGNGNMTKEVLYNLPSTGVAELITTTEYNFDTEQNPYKLFSKLMIPGINTNQNNIIKETYTIHLTADEGSDNVQVTENTYEYNAAGYPISKNGNIKYIYN